MPLTNYAELQATIEDYLENDDISGRITDFIRLAEVRMDRDLTIQGMHKQADLDLDTNVIALPVDFSSAIVWRVTSASPNVVAQQVTPQRLFGMVGASQGGAPRYYAIVGPNSHWAPDPTGVDAGTYTSMLEYHAKIPALTEGNATNWMLTKNPDAYLYGALIEAQPFLLDDERLTVWASMYKQSVDSIQGQDARYQHRPGGVMRSEHTTRDGNHSARY